MSNDSPILSSLLLDVMDDPGDPTIRYILADYLTDTRPDLATYSIDLLRSKHGRWTIACLDKWGYIVKDHDLYTGAHTRSLVWGVIDHQDDILVNPREQLVVGTIPRMGSCSRIPNCHALHTKVWNMPIVADPLSFYQWHCDYCYRRMIVRGISSIRRTRLVELGILEVH